MHDIKKRILAAGLASMLLLTGIPGSVYGASLYEKSETQTIADGVTHQNLLRFGDQGWVNVNVIRKDLKNTNSALQVVSSAAGVSSRDTVPNMAKQVPNTVAAVNADFFYLMKPDSPLGVMVKDGKLISSPVLVKPYNALSVTTAGQAYFSTWQNNLSVTTQRGETIPISAFNKITWNYCKTTILDRNWGTYTPGMAAAYADMVEIVVEDGLVKEVRQGQPPVAIPQNGFVLLASGANGQKLAASIAAGEMLVFNAATSPGIENLNLAVGGGTMLVQNGQIASFTEPVNGYASRTALGVNNAGDQLIMATVDGRSASYKGYDNMQMASLMLELGAYNAMMMDGGGSTTMLRRNLGESGAEVVTYASDGKLRPVINSLVVSSTGQGGELAGILLKSAQEQAFAGTPVSLSVKGYDKAYQPIAVGSEQVTYSVISGNGKIENSRLIPAESGTVIVEASYQGKTAQKTIKVLSDLAAIELNLSDSSVNPGDGVNLDVSGIDRNGYRAALSRDAVQFTDDKGLGTIQNGVYTAGLQEGSTIIRASFGGHKAAAALSSGYKRTPLKPLENYGYAFVSQPQTVTGQVSVAPGGQVNANAARLDYNFIGSTGTTAAYLTFASGGIPMTARPQKIGVWVNADQMTPHWIRGQIKDANGNAQTIEFKQGIDWTGWKHLEAAVPSNLAMPAYLERLYVVEPNEYKTQGTLLFDGLEMMMPLPLAQLSADERGGVTKDQFNQKPSSFEKKWLVYGGSSKTDNLEKVVSTLADGYEMALFTGPYDSTVIGKSGKTAAGTNAGYATATRDNELLVFLNDQNDGLRKTDYNQWPWLKNLLETTQKKNVLIFLQKPIWGTGGFSDRKEADLLGEQLSKLTEKGTNVYVFYGGGNTGIETRNGVRYLGTGKDKDQFISLYKKDGNILYTVDKLKTKR